MNNRITKTMRAKAGFTLVELIVVIAILGILAGVGTVGYSGYIKKANEAADNMLLSAVNTAFSAACIEKGDDINEVTSATLSLNGDKTVDEVSPYSEEFAKYFAGNENSAFKVFTSIVFDKDKHLFMDAVSAGYAAYTLGDGTVYIARADAKKLADSTFIKVIGIGNDQEDDLLDKVNDVTKFAAALDENSDVMQGVFEDPDFQEYFAKALGGDPSNLEEFEAKASALAADIKAKNPSLSSVQAMNQLRANAAVMYAANNATGMSAETITEFLSKPNPDNDLEKSTKQAILNNLGSDTGLAMSQAALAYGMYTAFAYSEQGNSDCIAKTSNPSNVIGDLDNPAFKNYMISEQGQKDLQGYLSALNMINSSAGDSEAVSYVLVNGFNDSSLKNVVNQAVQSAN